MTPPMTRTSSRFRPSLPLVVSLLALVVSLGGTSYAAAKINGNQIKPGTLAGKTLKAKTVKRAKIAPDTLTGAQVKEVTLGKVRAAGQADTAGRADLALDVPDGTIRAGHLGAITPRVSSRDVAAGASVTLAARCLPGEVAIAGGNSSGGDLLVRSSGRSQTDGWFYTVVNAGGATGSLTVIAYCLEP